MSSNIMDYCVDGYSDVSAGGLIGIFGNPIGHTLSPVIHDTLSLYMGIDEKYVPFCVGDAELGDCVHMAYEQGVLGLNITVPHKQAVIEHLVGIDDVAKAIGAVNTLVRTDGGYMGYNTDMPGLARALETENIGLRDRKVIVLGAGGAARAVAYMCVYHGAAEVHIINRTYEHAADIADDMNKIAKAAIVYAHTVSDYTDIPKSEYLMIQCTSVGLREGDGLPFDIDESFYAMADAGVDLIYNPIKTPFLEKLEKLGVPCINGLKMLLYQGIFAYELWNNVNISDTLADIVYLALQDAIYGAKRQDNIVLIGYMGAGKSTIGRKVAEKLSYKFIDTDEYIEKREGMKVADIFATKGEEYFRRLETELLYEFKDDLRKTVIATGGGVPLRAENRIILKELGTVYYLQADADTLYERVRDNSDRPLLKGENLHDKITSMLRQRQPIYECACHIRLRTDNAGINDIVDYIV